MQKIYSGDIETPGLHPVKGRDKIFGLAMFDGKRTKIYERDEIYQAKNILEDGDIKKIFHNFGFDGFWLLWTMGIKATNIGDTMLQEQVLLGDTLLNEKNATEKQLLELSSKLNWCLTRYGLPVHSKELQKSFARKPQNERLTPLEKKYMVSDVEQLIRLFMLQQTRLERLDLLRVANLENECVEVTVEMKCNGLGINVKRWEQIESDNQKRVSQLLKRLPPQVENWNSPAQAKKYFSSIGIPIASLKDITDDFTKLYNNPILNKYVEMRELQTQISKYGTNFLWIDDEKEQRYCVDLDGRIRPNFIQIKNTGRYSVAKPPVHGLPREVSDDAPVQWEHRQAFVPTKGNLFVSGDFSSQELGTMAAASKETVWLKALQRGEDPLSLMASIMFKDWAKETEKNCTFPKKCKCKMHKKWRQISKETTYGAQYGAWHKEIAKKIGRPEKETAELMEKSKRATPKLTRWSKGNAAFTIRTRTSFSADIYKRRRTVRDPLKWMVRNVGYNNPIQAAAANMMKKAMVEIRREIVVRGLKYKIVFTWHDDLTLEVPIKQAKQAAKLLQKVMEAAADYTLNVKGLIKVEPQILTSLSKK